MSSEAIKKVVVLKIVTVSRSLLKRKTLQQVKIPMFEKPIQIPFQKCIAMGVYLSYFVRYSQKFKGTQKFVRK